MRTLSHLAFALSLSAAVATASVACGGKDKPPLTPDQENPALLGPDAGVEMPSSPPPPAK